MPKYILFLAKLKVEGRPFWSIDLSSELSLTYGGNVNFYKSVHHPIPTRGNREHPGNFQNKSVSSPFNWVSRYILFLANWRVEEGLFWRMWEGWPYRRLPSKALGCHKRWRSLCFCEIWNKVPQDMESYEFYVDRFQDMSKVKNPAVSKAKV